MDLTRFLVVLALAACTVATTAGPRRVADVQLADDTAATADTDRRADSDVPRDTGGPPDTDPPDTDTASPSATVAAVLALTPDLANGEDIYVDVAECVLCHGADGNGKGLDAEFDYDERLPGLTDAEIVATVIDGVDDTLMVGFAWTNSKKTQRFLEDQDIADVVAYIKTFLP